MMYSVDVIRSNIAEAVEVLTDAVLNPKFNPWEVNEAVDKLKGDLTKFKGHHQNILTEVLLLLTCLERGLYRLSFRWATGFSAAQRGLFETSDTCCEHSRLPSLDSTS